MDLYLYDTWQRKIRLFTPIHSDFVGMYCCGPTVYDYAHIGNLRTYLFEDTIRRVLQFNGYKVQHVINITDVGHLVSDGDHGEDKMEMGSQRTGGKSAWEIAEIYTEAFQNDMQMLNILSPQIYSKATEHIQEQINFIQLLENKGFTYRTDDGIYFDSSKQDQYGYLARLDIQNLKAGIRVEIGSKQHATDFALWKFSPLDQKRQMQWDSPWGIGFPGWHIECSAMSVKYLSSWFDIHCGGEDHISIHHCNEIAQNQAGYGSRGANFWMHGYFLQLDHEKMSKSNGDFLRLQSLIDQDIDPLAYRYLNLTAHYRKQLNFNWDALKSAEQALNRLRISYATWQNGGCIHQAFLDQFHFEINQDLNTPKALALLWNLVKSDIPDMDKKATIRKFDEVLGLGLAHWVIPNEVAIPKQIQLLIEKRKVAKSNQDWALSDQLRKQIFTLGYLIKDLANGDVQLDILKGKK